MNQIQTPEGKKHAIELSGWIGIGVLCLFFAASIWFATEAWERAAVVAVSTNGKIAMLLGIVITTFLGAGLMALVFWSSRKGYDR